jgi:hypothetical protein
MTGTLINARWLHTATLLANGKVLVTGGSGPNNRLATAEVYDSTTGIWTATGAMHAARDNHTATLLPNGKVLVAGGLGNNGSLASGELYDPATGAWTVTGTLISGRSSHTATLLPNGTVLVTGGTQNGNYLNSAEVYDPVTGIWTATGWLNTARQAHTATLLPSGMVLVAGGCGMISLTSEEVYDPASGIWTLTGSLPADRIWHAATLLPNRKVLIVGGINTSILSSAELYDVGIDFSLAWQSQITTLTSPLALGSRLELTGSGFDYPVVQLRSLESGQTLFLLSTNWQTNSFTSEPVWGFPPGYALATVYVSGIPSTGSVLNVSVPIPAATALTDARRLTNGACQFCFTNNAGALFGVLATTNPALPLSNWTALGGATEVAPGQFQFTDPQAANSARRFYRLRSP